MELKGFFLRFYVYKVGVLEAEEPAVVGAAEVVEPEREEHLQHKVQQGNLISVMTHIFPDTETMLNLKDCGINTVLTLTKFVNLNTEEEFLPLAYILCN